MKEYLKMEDAFSRKVDPITDWDEHGHEVKWITLLSHQAEHAVHAINSHDELVAEVERLRDMVVRMQTYLDMAGEYPEKESDNPVRQWLFDAIDCTKQ